MRLCISETTWLRNGTIKLHCRAPVVLSANFSAREFNYGIIM